MKRIWHLCMDVWLSQPGRSAALITLSTEEGWEWQRALSDGLYLLHIHKFLSSHSALKAWPPFLLPPAPRAGGEGQYRAGLSESLAFSEFLLCVRGSTHLSGELVTNSTTADGSQQ